MKYQRGFLNQQELNTLTKSTLQGYDPANNIISLSGIDEIKQKIQAQIEAHYGVSTEFLMAYLFLACETTMEKFEQSLGWHTDGSCNFVDGDCFNAWLPIYNDSNDTGMEIISDKENPELYRHVGDQTHSLQIFNRQHDAATFAMVRAPQEADMLVINHFSGDVFPFDKSKLNISKIEKPQLGDLAIFKQTDIHRGFHNGGVRIQLSLKFISSEAKLNTKASNSYYKLFEKMTGGGSIHQFLAARSALVPPRRLSKHGKLEGILVKTLLNNQLAKNNGQ